MKPVRQSRYQSGPAVKLYLDDIEAIIRILKGESGEILFRDDEHNYDSLAELIELRGTRPRVLEISRKGPPRVSLRLQSMGFHGVRLHAGQTFLDEDGGDLEFFKIQEILNRRRRYITRLCSYGVWMGVSIIGIILLPILLIMDASKPLVITFAVPAALASVMLVFSTLVLAGFPTSINLSRRHEATTFWTRNGESIVLSSVSAVFGAILGACATKFVEFLVR